MNEVRIARIAEKVVAWNRGNYPDWAPAPKVDHSRGSVELNYEPDDKLSRQLEKAFDKLAPGWIELNLEIDWKGSAENSVETGLQWQFEVTNWDIDAAYLNMGRGEKAVRVPAALVRKLENEAYIEEDLNYYAPDSAGY